MNDIAKVVYPSPRYWLAGFLLAPAMSLLLDITIMCFQRTFMPTHAQVVLFCTDLGHGAAFVVLGVAWLPAAVGAGSSFFSDCSCLCPLCIPVPTFVCCVCLLPSVSQSGAWFCSFTSLIDLLSGQVLQEVEYMEEVRSQVRREWVGFDAPVLLAVDRALDSARSRTVLFARLPCPSQHNVQGLQAQQTAVHC